MNGIITFNTEDGSNKIQYHTLSRAGSYFSLRRLQKEIAGFTTSIELQPNSPNRSWIPPTSAKKKQLYLHADLLVQLIANGAQVLSLNTDFDEILLL